MTPSEITTQYTGNREHLVRNGLSLLVGPLTIIQSLALSRYDNIPPAMRPLLGVASIAIVALASVSLWLQIREHKRQRKFRSQ